ncbi:hypothetical protein HAD_08505 [Hyphomonas adhaerens MHS-3]|uniref:Glycosyltransferase n=1 Tax=Hyphomonas adhaerens MHS-3 TaxID=1280949 RepID=A0A069E6Q1_9PROT|nr:glycosyltransferase [Hyphomonas adhaerens]KCZ85712.1 hypothetical protein HAD_08505 [Hyphomonas adhaerens MHS-3]
MSNLKEVKTPDQAEGLHSVATERKRDRLVVLVLGMHRSGTSAVTGLVSKLGVGLPEHLLAPQADNERGFFESEDIVMAHERLFAAIGTTWSGLDDLDGVENTPAGKAFIKEMRVLLERQFEHSSNLVLKDPRICRLAPLWLKLIESLDSDVICLHVSRHPLAVAASLSKRNKFAPGRSILMWLDHALRAERETRGLPRIFVDFDQVMNDWRPLAERLAEMLGNRRKLSAAAKVDIETFLSQELRHHEFLPSDIMSDDALPSWVQTAYQNFELTFDGQGAAEPDPVQLDRAWDDFDRARSLFNETISDHVKEAAGLRAELEQTARTLQEREADLSRLREEKEKAAAELHASYAAIEAEFSKAREHLQASRKETDLLKAQLSEANDRADRVEAARAELEALLVEAENVKARLRQAENDLSTERETGLRLRRQYDENASYSRYLESHAKALEKTVREIRESTSWKITAPLRRVRGIRTPRTPEARHAEKPSSPEPGEPGRTGAAAAAARPSKTAPAPVRRNAPVDIIVPVYRGLETTRACIESVYASDPGVPYELIIIDDCSPEPDVSAYVASLAGRPHTTVLKNEQNKGFVGTVNRGMSLNPGHDVVLLNSDTEVANDWLRRMVEAAYSAPKISSVTPFSNNATICSYPRYCDENTLPEGLSLAELDKLFAEANPAGTVDIPTAVGFCMFITRDSLDALGLFDEDAFGKGYGEENDFCLRGAHHGWRHLLAADTFVFHKGGVSFAETALKQQEKASVVIRDRWPSYFNDVAQHVSKDPERPFRIAATAMRYKRDTRPVVLAVTHPYGGGVERQIDDVKELCAPYALFLTLRPAADGMVRLESDTLDGVEAEYHLELERGDLIRQLKDFGVERVHIHHSMGYSDALHDLVRELGVPFDFTVHDYYSICPRAHLGGTESTYCGEPDEAACNACIKRDFPVYHSTISDYRDQQAWTVRDADRVIAPSADTARRMTRYFPDAEIRTIPHTPKRALSLDIGAPPLARDERLRILVLGVLAPHKGLSRVAEFVRLADEAGAPVEVHLLGSVGGAMPESDRFTDHGTYIDAELGKLIDQVDPHLIWFPAQVPETFSFTLGAAIASGRPVAAADLGALPERLSGRPWSWVLPWKQTAEEFLGFVTDAREKSFLTGAPPVAPQSELAAPLPTAFYQIDYLAPMQAKAPMIGRGARRRIVAVDHNVMPTACGQIRLALPLTHPALSSDVAFSVLPLEEAMKADADAIVVQRTAVPDPDMANRLADRCDRKGIRKLFEIDDDLFELPESHPEKAIYADLLRGAEAFMTRADRVVVTTEVIAERMQRYNPAVTVFPNYLDDRIWFAGAFGAPLAREAGEPLRVAFAGGSTHREDIDSIMEGLRAAVSKRPGKFEFHMVGAGPTDDAGLPLIRRQPPPERAGHYVRFVDWLRRSADWHAAIAPLVPDRFNRAKSPLKFLDYGALGLAGIYASGAPFEGVVADGETGILATDPEEWAEALIRLADDEAARFAMAAAARAEIRNHHTLAANAETIRTLWQELAG